jgi:hypothetical protein
MTTPTPAEVVEPAEPVEPVEPVEVVEVVEPVETPLLHIHGNATDEEVAALVTVVQALAAAAPAPTQAEPRRPSEWGSPRRSLRPPHAPGPGGWRASALPR